MANVNLAELLTATSRGQRVSPPDELVRAVEGLGFGDAFVCCHATESFDQESGLSNWQVTLATHTAVIEVIAGAGRVSTTRGAQDSYPVDWSAMFSGGRAPKSYRDLPQVTLMVRLLKDLSELHIAAKGATDSYEDDELVRETWTFTFRDASSPLVFNVDHSDRDCPASVDVLCRHLAGQL